MGVYHTSDSNSATLINCTAMAVVKEGIRAQKKIMLRIMIKK
jgi:hypothetical protein